MSVRQFEQADLVAVFDRADDMRQGSQTLAGRRRLMRRYGGYVMATMFYEPSTRTRLSFEFAAERLGIRVCGTENAAEFSSAAKGETIEDSTRVIAAYADIVVMRHKENGAAERAAAVSRVPVINAGDGTGEHPTQALLDLYTIRQELGRLHGLRAAVIGDLKHGRTVRSLAQLLALYPDNHITFVAPPSLQIGDDIKQYLTERHVTFEETDNMQSALRQADVVYQTRMQKERHDDMAKLAAGAEAGNFTIGQEELSLMQQHAIVMHPLPRVGEITAEVDEDPRAAYFRQAENGLYVRMALLDILLGGER